MTTWHWGSKYGREYLDRLVRGLGTHLSEPHRFVVVRPEPQDEYLTALPGCFARLRMFDPAWQAAHLMEHGDRIVCVDLDVVITGSLDPVFDRPEPFCILQGANSANPCPYNGSLMMVRAGAHSEVWSHFSLAAARAVPFYEFPDDQGWLAHMVPGAAGWRAGPQSGVYAFQKPGWPKGEALPSDARLVAFPGWRDPSKFMHLPWIREHWR